MRGVLVVGPESRDTWELRVPEAGLRIGSSEQCEVALACTSLAGVHATVSPHGDAFVLTSLDHQKGTFIEGRRVRRAELRHGTRFRCGDQLFGFELRADSDRDSDRDSHREPQPALMLESEPRDSSLSATDLASQWKSGWRGAESSGDVEALERQLLLKTAEWLSLPQPVETILERVLDLAIETLGADRGVVLLAREDTGELEPRTVRAPGGDANPVSAFSRRIVQHVYERGVAALFQNPLEDHRIDGSDSVRRHAITSSMCAPLTAEQRVFGVIYVDCRTSRDPLGRRELDVLSAMASQAAVALENSKLRIRLEREAVRRSQLSRFFPPTIVQEMLDRPETLDEPREVEVTALFCDVSGFTPMVAEMRPLAVAELLNHYLPVMVDIVFALGGTLEKYVGDAILAVWGAPLSSGDDARRAVEAACQMQRAVAELIEARAVPERFAVHIGLSSGIVAAGNIGTESYMQYATVGFATNLASRICDVVPGGSIWICDATHARIAQAGFQCSALESLPLKGVSDCQQLYEVMWRGEQNR